ncbi:hypothetical protein ALC60_07039 [Trachymyrmex zeteki]|uniref:Uncharacterized protein n=1 Tax=Mycetomoellerius zeteki TaxID=64791 RepID=A0A151X0Y3_9HYME|nr:hypothetical protein ALC60_07039 [Trachymyrmex zeteki]
MLLQKRKLDSYIDYISDQQKARINDTLAKFFYGCNIPFKKLESKLFLNFIKAIRPAYSELSAKTMSNKILNKVHTEFREYQSTFTHFEGILVVKRTEIKHMSHVIGFVHSQEKVIYVLGVQKSSELVKFNLYSKTNEKY